jgi:hypothetical protein
LNQKVLEVGDALIEPISWSTHFPVESGHLTQCTLNVERDNPDRFLESGSEVAIPNDGLPE